MLDPQSVFPGAHGSKCSSQILRPRPSPCPQCDWSLILRLDLVVTTRAVTYWLSGQRNLTSAHVLGGLKRLADEAAYALASPSELADPVLAHYEGLMRLLDRTASAPVHRRLQVVTGKTSALTALLARDGGLWSWSKHYTNPGIGPRVGGHGGLEAGALGDLAYLLSPDFGDGSRADVERSLVLRQQASAVAKCWCGQGRAPLLRTCPVGGARFRWPVLWG
ncbi:MAG: hypothetical protein ACRDZ4_24060, partial [Egibacteraceae bacterium]